MAVLMIVGLVAAACGDDDGAEDAGAQGDGAEEAAQDPYAGLTYGIPSPLATEPGEHNINLGITCWADAHEGEVITLDSELDVNKQISDFDNLLAQGADVLPFLPLDPNAFSGPFQRAEEAGAVVVELYNPDSTAAGSVYEASREAGEDAVVFVEEQFPDGAKAVVIGGPPIPVILERVAGFTDNAEARGIEVVDQADNLKDNVNDARRLADDLYTKNPDIDVVFGFNDNSAIGAGLAAKARDLDLLIFGMNGTAEGVNAVKDGTITATYEADQFLIGHTGAEVGAKIHAGEDVEPVAVSMVRWDESNADEWLPVEQRCDALTDE
jgi:ribose transport system substrate-binding protein